MAGKTIYLAGPIFDCTDPECNDWRARAMAELGHKYDFLNPMRRDYRGQTDEHYKEIVEDDKADIDKCHIILANCSKNSAGTSMEVIYAWERGKLVVSFEGHSPWVKYHSHIFCKTMEQAIELLKMIGTNNMIPTELQESVKRRVNEIIESAENVAIENGKVNKEKFIDTVQASGITVEDFGNAIRLKYPCPTTEEPDMAYYLIIKLP